VEIIVEIGAESQQSLIKKELSYLYGLCDGFEPALELSQIIIPQDIDACVNRLIGSDSFHSVWSTHQVAAKLLPIAGKHVLVVSPLWYTEPYDDHCRAFIFMHEMMHVWNKHRFPHLIDYANIPFYYFENIYTMYDEYYADRKALEIVDYLFEEKSNRFLTMKNAYIADFSKNFVQDQDWYDLLCESIGRFRVNGNVDHYLREISDSVNEILKALVHLYSHFDHYPQHAEREEETRGTRFVGDSGLALVKYFRDKYCDDSVDLLDGIELIEAYMQKLGVRFEMLENNQVCCHVVDV